MIDDRVGAMTKERIIFALLVLIKIASIDGRPAVDGVNAASVLNSGGVVVPNIPVVPVAPVLQIATNQSVVISDRAIVTAQPTIPAPMPKAVSNASSNVRVPVPPSTDVLSLWDPSCIRLVPVPLLLAQPVFHVFARGVNKYDQFKAATMELDIEVATPPFVHYSAKSYVRKFDQNGYFAKGRQVIFVVHGFFGNICPSWMNDTKSKILAAEDSTVILVNWQLTGDNPLYNTAAATTQTIAYAIAKVAEYILETKTFGGKKDGAYFYCVGHSLGAQTCGQAGRLAKTRDGHQLFDRVTALDPAGPGFERCSDGLHVDKDSAPCVDVVHSDGTIKGHIVPVHFGTMLQWGHMDFYPNGGDYQPFCSLLSNNAGCSHNAALDYFVTTIADPSACEADGPCYDGTDIEGSCAKGRTQNMGYWSTCHRSRLAERTEGIFYVNMTKNAKCTASPIFNCINTDGFFFSVRSSIPVNTFISGWSLVDMVANTSDAIKAVVPSATGVGQVASGIASGVGAVVPPNLGSFFSG